MPISIDIPYSKTFETRGSVAEAYTFLTNYEQAIGRCFPGLEKFELAGIDSYRWVFPKFSYGGHDLQINLVTLFSKTAPSTITMSPSPLSGKTQLHGKWEILSFEGKTTIHFQIKICLELPLPFLLKSIAEPLAKKEIIKLFDRYLENVAKALTE